MKKGMFVLLILCSLFLLMAIAGYAAESEDGSLHMVLQVSNPMMEVNGNKQEIDPGRGTAPIIQNGRAMAPVRAVIETMGGAVSWNQDAKETVLTYGEDTIRLTVGSTEAYLNGEPKVLDTAPIVMNGRTLLPLRFIAESFHFEISWSQANQTVTIDSAQGAAVSGQGDGEENPNILIAYFSLWGSADYGDGIDASSSASVNLKDGKMYGTTEQVARMIQETVGGTLFRIETDEAYSSDFGTVVSTAREERNTSARPAIKGKIENIDQYGVVFVGFPIWSSTVPNVILSFLEEYDLSGKTVIPFCTHDGYGRGNSFDVVAEKCPGAATGTDGFAVASSEIVGGDLDSVRSNIEAWAEGLNIGIVKAEQGVGQTPINITVGGRVLSGYLNDTPEAQQFKAMLPVTVSMSGYGGREYYGSISGRIENTTEGKLNFENGDITYCPSNNTAAIFYAQTDRPDLTMRVIRMGKVTSSLSIFDELESREEITFTLAE